MKHGGVLLDCFSSVAGGVPHHQRDLDDDERERDGREIPAGDVVHEIAVLEQQDGNDRGGDARRARRSEPVSQESLVEEAREQSHECFSSAKISSVGTLNTSANASASG